MLLIFRVFRFKERFTSIITALYESKMILLY
jgi:hypothetical protein